MNAENNVLLLVPETLCFLQNVDFMYSLCKLKHTNIALTNELRVHYSLIKTTTSTLWSNASHLPVCHLEKKN
jgi:hypothetical protein